MSYISAVYLYFGPQSTPIDHLQVFEHKATPADLVAELKIDLKRAGIEMSSAMHIKTSSNYLDEAALHAAFMSELTNPSAPSFPSGSPAQKPQQPARVPANATSAMPGAVVPGTGGCPSCADDDEDCYDDQEDDDDNDCSQTPSDYYFAVDVCQDTSCGYMFTVVSKEFWNANHHLDGFGFYPSILDAVGLSECSENYFEFDDAQTTAEDIKQKLKVFGMTQNQAIAGGVPDPLAKPGVPEIDAITPGSQDPHDYLFAVGIDSGKQYLVLTPKESWGIYRTIDDTGFIPDFMSNLGLVYAGEGVYHAGGTKSVNKCALELRTMGATQDQEII